MSEQEQSKEEARPINQRNYARLVELVTYFNPDRRVWEEREVQFFNNDPLSIQTVVGALIEKVALSPNPSRVAVYDRRPLSASLAAQVFEVGTWACPRCGLEKDGKTHCQCKDKKAA
jgi:hypothetical protein